MFALNLGVDGRVLSATYPRYAPKDAVQVEEIPIGNLANYLYKDGEFAYSPMETEPVPEPDTEPTSDELLNILMGVSE